MSLPPALTAYLMYKQKSHLTVATLRNRVPLQAPDLI